MTKPDTQLTYHHGLPGTIRVVTKSAFCVASAWTFLGFFLTILCFAQEAEHPVELSPVIGDTLDAMERSDFMLLPEIKHFGKAVFYLNPDSTLRARVFRLQEGQPTDTLVLLPRSLTSIRNQISQINQNRKSQQPEDFYEREDELLHSDTGNRVRIETATDSVFVGELLATRTNTIVINTDDLTYKPPCKGNCLILFRRDQIKKLSITRGSPLGIFVGITVGAFFGCFLGGYTGLAVDDRNGLLDQATYTTLGMKIGALVGMFAGWAIARKTSIEWNTGDPQDFLSYRDYARYRNEEPQCLQNMQ